MGIEPTSSAWEAEVLPLNHTRVWQWIIALRIGCFQDDFSRVFDGGERSPLRFAAMKIIVNGEERQVADGYTAAQLVEDLGLAGRRLAMEVNLDIVPRSAYPEHAFKEGDRIEVVQAIGGGSPLAV